MSCGYDFVCTDCNASTDFDLNHGGEQLVRMMAARPELEAIGKSLAGPDCWFFTDDGGRVWSVARFMAHHAGHRVVVRDEYGREWDECGQPIDCPTCDHRDHCRRKEGHAGAHKPKRDEP